MADPAPNTAAALAAQFDRAWAMLRTAIDATPEDEWRRAQSSAPGGEDAYLTPARQAYHAVEMVDFYLGGPFEVFPWGQRFGGADWERAPADRLPARADVVAYLDEIADRLGAFLRACDDRTIMMESPFTSTGATFIEHWLYVLRHTQHHLAVMGTVLRARGVTATAWK